MSHLIKNNRVADTHIQNKNNKFEENNEKMIQYLKQQVNQKAPTIIKGHHYLIINYLNSLSNGRPNYSQRPANQPFDSYQTCRNSQNATSLTFHLDNNFSSLRKSLELKPSRQYQGCFEKQTIKLPSLLSQQMPTQTLKHHNAILQKRQEQEAINHTLARKHKKYQSLEINQLQIYQPSYEKKKNHSFLNENKKFVQSAEEQLQHLVNKNYLERKNPSLTHRYQLANRKLLYRQNSKSESQQRFKTIKQNLESIRNSTIEYEPFEQQESILIASKEQNKHSVNNRHQYPRHRQKKSLIIEKFEQRGNEEKSRPCPWQSHEEADVLLNLGMFESTLY